MHAWYAARHPYVQFNYYYLCTVLGKIVKLPGVYDYKLYVLYYMSRMITGLRFRGTYCSPPASTAEACVALADDHLAFAALALLEGLHWQHGAKQQS